MAEAVELKASARERTGTGGARAVRREGRVPGVVYGEKTKPQPIAIDYKTIWQQIHTGHFLSTLYLLDVDGDRMQVIPREVQLDPVRDFPIHVDFMRVAKDALITVAVPARFLNEPASPGLKRGGVLNVVRHEIEVRCPVDAIPDHFDFDLTGLEIGDSLHISAITMPDGVQPTITDRDFTVATIVGRAAEEEVAPPTEEAEAEGEAAEGAEAAPAEGEEAEKAEKSDEKKDEKKKEEKKR